MHNRKMVAAILRQVKRWQRYKMEIISCHICPVGMRGWGVTAWARYSQTPSQTYQVKQQ